MPTQSSPSTGALIMTKGLPASGKSTWSEREVHRRLGRTVRITKDQLRAMLHANGRNGKTERQVLAARDALIHTYLSSGMTVIIDDTNLAPHHESRLRQLAAEHYASFSVQDFTDVPLETCLERNAARANRVDSAVIRQMWIDYLAAPSTPEPIEAVPTAVICDIDGTLATMHRRPYDWHLVHTDTPNAAVVTAVQAFAAAGMTIVYASGRDGSCREATLAWLAAHVGVDGPLYMRAAGDNRKDSVVKRELYDQHIRGRYNVAFVLDDRNQVVDLWRHELGLVCFQVAEGDF